MVQVFHKATERPVFIAEFQIGIIRVVFEFLNLEITNSKFYSKNFIYLHGKLLAVLIPQPTYFMS